jgi:transcriptional regulator with XRE-family HTH domain
MESQPSTSHQPVGHSLRRWRQLRELTLKELADRVGCSESMLSKIEKMRVNPSLKLLRKLAEALAVNIGALFPGDSHEAVVSRRGHRPLLHADNLRHGPGIILERLVPYEKDSMLQANIHHIAPGGSSDGVIVHAGEEMGVLLRGTLELQVDQETYLLHPGDSFHFRSERPHGYRNAGTEPVEVVWVSTPPTF